MIRNRSIVNSHIELCASVRTRSFRGEIRIDWQFKFLSVVLAYSFYLIIVWNESSLFVFLLPGILAP